MPTMPNKVHSSTPALLPSCRPLQCGDEVVDVADDGPLSAKTLFGHVRAASEGSVSPTNSHPFVFGSLLWMHNGAMPNFGAFKDTLKSRLRPSVRGLVVGQVTKETPESLLGGVASPRAAKCPENAAH